MTNRFVLLLRQLHDKTAAGTVKWQTTADEDSFRIGLGEGIVRISKREDRDHDLWIMVALLDKKGREVESVNYFPAGVAVDDEDDARDFLPELFALARRSALNIDDLLESMEKDLEAGQTRPIPDPPKRKDDDIPF